MMEILTFSCSSLSCALIFASSNSNFGGGGMGGVLGGLLSTSSSLSSLRLEDDLSAATGVKGEISPRRRDTSSDASPSFVRL